MKPSDVSQQTFSTIAGTLHIEVKRRWLYSLLGVILLSSVSNDLTLGLWGLGYFLYAASTITSQGWL